MALIDTLQRPSSRGLVKGIARAYSVWRQRRALGRLGADALDDIGVTPAQARKEANRPLWDVPDTWRH